MLIGLGRLTVRWRKAILVGAAVFVVASFVIAGGVADKLTTGGFADPNVGVRACRRHPAARVRVARPQCRAARDRQGRHRRRCRGRRRGGEDHRGAHRRARQHRRVVLEPRQRAAAREPRSPPGARARCHRRQRRPRRRRHQDIVARVHRDNATVSRRGRWSRRGVPPGRRDHQVGSQPRREHRAADHADPAGDRVRQPHRRRVAAARRHRRDRGSFLVLYVVASITDVSVYSLNLTTALGLGLAIDYSLFIVSRYREELQHGLAPHDAVVRTVATAGRTVAGSALTVAVSLTALLAVPARVPPLVRLRRHRGRAARRARCGRRPARDARGARHEGELGADLPAPRAEAGG